MRPSRHDSAVGRGPTLRDEVLVSCQLLADPRIWSAVSFQRRTADLQHAGPCIINAALGAD